MAIGLSCNPPSIFQLKEQVLCQISLNDNWLVKVKLQIGSDLQIINDDDHISDHIKVFWGVKNIVFKWIFDLLQGKKQSS